MRVVDMFRRYFRADKPRATAVAALSEPEMIARGWDAYAREWAPGKLAVVPGHLVEYLGDEWTSEDTRGSGTDYGLPPDVMSRFARFLEDHLLNPYLPRVAAQGLEIGPGGGRLTQLLLPRTTVLHVVDVSEAMLQHVQRRFAHEPKLRYYLADGMTLPALQPASLEYVIAFDVFVHFEPRLVCWYLRQIAPLLKAGGTGIIHYANILTPGGWRLFERELESNVRGRQSSGSFGTMCPSLMHKFLEALSLQVLTEDTGLIPRDAVVVFRKPSLTTAASEGDSRSNETPPDWP
jgi:SAM-dependent methyltransferase